MGVKFTNNAATTLAAGINNSATSITVASSSTFPSISGSNYFYATLDDLTNNEVVKVTAVSGTTWTVVRAQDDTSARAFSSGDTVELRLNVALLEDALGDAATFARDAFTGTGSATAFTLSQTAASENNLIVFIEGIFQTQSTYSLSGTTLTFSTAPANSREIIVYSTQALSAGTVTTASIVDANITTAKLADDAVTVAKMAVNSIDSDQYVDGSIDTAHIAADAVTAAKLADNAVVTANIADDNVTTAKIADDQITLAKMAGLVRGKIIYGDSSGNPAALTVGSNGQVLKSDGTDIAWAADTDTALTSEEVQDIAGAMFTSNTETGITATYQDADGTIDLVVGTLNQDTTGTAATVTTAAQTNITSLGTLTALTGGTGDLIWDTPTFVVDSSANSVGIGTSSPTEKLQVNGAIRSTGNAANTPGVADSGVFYFIPTADDGSNPRTVVSGVGTSSVGGHVTFKTGTTSSNTEKMRITSDGNVGIGITTPNEGGFGANSNVLSIAGAAQNEMGVLELISTDVTSGNRIGEIRFGNLDAGSSFASNAGIRAIRDGADNSSALSLWTTNAGTFHEVITVKADKKVGLGTTTPDARLDIEGMIAGEQALLITSPRNDALSNGLARINITDANCPFTGLQIDHAGTGIALDVGGVMRASTGIEFGTDTAAANQLDDYEEGTWTPAFYTYSGVTTSSITTYGIYTKIGRIVHIHAKITCTLSSLPGQTVTITGLPYAATNTSDTGQRSIIAIGGDSYNTGANTPKAHFRTDGSQLHGVAWNASNNTATWTYSSMDAQPFEMHIHGHYTT